MSKNDKKCIKTYKNLKYLFINDIQSVKLYTDKIINRLYDVCVKYRTRIGRLKRQVQQLNRENKLLREQYNILFNDGRNMYQELKELKNGNETN